MQQFSRMYFYLEAMKQKEVREFFTNEDRRKLKLLKGAEVETTKALPEVVESQADQFVATSQPNVEVAMTPVQEDWREYSNARNPLVLQNFMDLEEMDLNYDLMATYDPNELTSDVKYFVERLKDPKLTKF